MVLPTVSQWLTFTQQWDPKSPWADQRVSLAVNLGIDRKTFGDAEYLGKPAPSIIPRDFEFYWTPSAYPYDPARRSSWPRRATPRVSMPSRSPPTWCSRPGRGRRQWSAVDRDPRAPTPDGARDFYKADQERQFKYLVRVGSGAGGNAATRIEAFVISGGIRSYGGYPDIDALFRDQAGEMDPKRREALLHKIQQLMYGAPCSRRSWSKPD